MSIPNVLCAPTVLPTFSDFHSLMLPAFQKPDLEILLPSLPTLPWPPSKTHRDFSLEKAMAAGEMVTAQMLNMLKALMQPLASVLGGTLESFLPKIPILDINLLDLVPGPPDFSAIVEKIKALAGKFPPQYPNFSMLFSLIPEPLYPQLDMPDLSAIQIFQAAIKSYMVSVVTTITNMVNQVLDKLEIVGSLTLPTLPSMETVLAILKAQVSAMVGAQVESLKELLQGLSQLVSNAKNTILNAKNALSDVRGAATNFLLSLSFPGFPAISLPLPITPGSDRPDFDLVEIVKNTFSDLITSQIKRVYDFVESTLGMLGFSFPKICIPVLTFAPPALPTPTLPSPSIPTLPSVPTLPIS